jgi:hypothetical protein
VKFTPRIDSNEKTPAVSVNKWAERGDASMKKTPWVDVFKNEFEKLSRGIGKSAGKIPVSWERGSWTVVGRDMFAVRLRAQICDEGVGGQQADRRR